MDHKSDHLYSFATLDTTMALSWIKSPELNNIQATILMEEQLMEKKKSHMSFASLTY